MLHADTLRGLFEPAHQACAHSLAPYEDSTALFDAIHVCLDRFPLSPHGQTPLQTTVAFALRRDLSAHARIAAVQRANTLRAHVHAQCAPFLQALKHAIPALQGPASQCSLMITRDDHICSIHANHHLIARRDVLDPRHLMAFITRAPPCAPATTLYQNTTNKRYVAAASAAHAQAFVEATGLFNVQGIDPNEHWTAVPHHTS